MDTLKDVSNYTPGADAAVISGCPCVAVEAECTGPSAAGRKSVGAEPWGLSFLGYDGSPG